MLDDGVLIQELWENMDLNKQKMYPYGPKGPVPKNS